MFTKYHAKYFALELSKRSPSNSIEKFTASLLDAQVDLNPHQVDAALFAFQSPLSKWAILADEVWLWKTIEAWILLSQKWAERKRKILIIAPANLRKQWNQELQDKFFLPSIILESKNFNETIKRWNLNPFIQNEIVIASYQFVRSKEAYVKAIAWDLVVIDEAHRLRNVYKPGNKIAKAIKDSVLESPKVLLTATPLQNSLLELYGLVGIIDDNIFWDQKSFRSQFSRAESTPSKENFDDLKERLRPICKRTLRKQVLEYIKYTNRIALVEEFYQSKEEQELYDLLSDYLSRKDLYALPASQRILMELILRRLLASSTYAIADTFSGLVKKLEVLLVNIRAENVLWENWELEKLDEKISENFEEYDEFAEEWGEEEEESEWNTKKKKKLTFDDIPGIESEILFLRRCGTLAKSIDHNSKWDRLAIAINKWFEELEKNRLRSEDKKYPLQKALIFTESTRTQSYIKEILEKNGYWGKVVLFNGSNNDPDSQKIYKAWLSKHAGTDKITGSKSADMRAAIVEYFRDEATIMIATEAAAEGINLQFCSFIINYDLPWNPQRIEQRIGRCHRYWQKADVVVLNFLNKSNAADQRVYQLLDVKFKLFEWVFGVSDEVLWSIENGINLERRIAKIYSECRTVDEINSAFDILQEEYKQEIDESIKDTRHKLLSNFDEEVSQKLKFQKSEAEASLTKYQNWLWDVTQFALSDKADFSNDYSFQLRENPFSEEKIFLGPYRIGKNIEDAHIYRIWHPLAENVIQECLVYDTRDTEIIFDYSKSGKNISMVKGLLWKAGWIELKKVTVEAFESEDILIFSAITDDWTIIDQETIEKLFWINGIERSSYFPPTEDLRNLLVSQYEHEKDRRLKKMDTRNMQYFEEENEKLAKWGDDRKLALKNEMKDLEDEIKEQKKKIRNAWSLPDKLSSQKELRVLEKKFDDAETEYQIAKKEIDKEKDLLIERIEARLHSRVDEDLIFQIRFSII